MKIYNLLGRSGRAVPNQFVVENNQTIIFQSYESICAIYYKNTKKLAFGEDWDYSRTTVKYLHQFLDEYVPLPYHNKSTKELRKMVSDGVIEYYPNRDMMAL